MPITGPSMQVKADTTVKDVRNFLEANAINKNAKILGQYDDTTKTTTLYIKTGPRTLKERLNGDYKQHKTDAKQAFAKLLTKSSEQAQATRKLNPKDQKDVNGIIKAVNSRLGEVGGKSVKAGQLWLMAAMSESLSTYGTDKNAPPDGPKRSIVKNLAPEVRTSATALKDIVQNNKSVDTEAARLGDKIATKFLAQHKGPITRLNFATSTGEAFKKSMLNEMAKAIGGDEGKALAKDPKAIELVNKAFDIAASKILPNQELPNQTKQVLLNKNPIDLPFIKIGKTTYEPVKHLGTGGFAEVYEYKATDGSNKTIAYKISNANDTVDQSGDLASAPIKDIGAEVRSHRQMTGKGHENVVGLVGAIRTPDGRLGIAMEVANGGALNEFAANMKGAIGTGTGKISNEMANLVKLTLLQDMAKGLSHIQEKQGMLHLDLKSPNVLIGADGKAKIADFGLSKKGDEANVDQIKTPDNPSWLAPELIAGKSKIADIGNFKTDSMKKKFEAIRKDLENYFDRYKKDESAQKSMGSVILRQTINRKVANENLTIDNKADTWSLGVAAMDLFRGDLQYSNFSFFSAIEEKLTKFFNTPGGTAIADTNDQTQVGPTQLFASTGNKAVDKLLNDTLLQRDPNDRPKLSDFANNAIFDTPGVGSPEIRNLIKALSSGNADQIDQAKLLLQAALS